jgi:hypothetical protein
MSCSATAVDEKGRPLKADWNKASEGIFLCGIAIFFLLNTTGLVPWSFWFEAIPLWPLLIVSAGIKMTFEKTRAPWMVLLGPAVVLAGLAWVATGATFDVTAGKWTTEGPLPRPEGARHVKLDIDLMASRLHVEGRELEQGALADARSIERLAKTKLAVSRDGDTAILRLDSTGKGSIAWLPGRREHWQLGVPTDIPLNFDLHGVMVRGRFDLARSRVEAGHVNGVFLATRVALPPVEETVKVRLNGVFNVLRVSVPKGTTVRLKGTGVPFNLMKRRVVGDPNKPGYEITVDGIFNAIAVDVRNPPRPDEPGEAAPGDAPPAEEGATDKPPAEAPPTSPAPKASPSPESGPSPAASPASVRG